MKEFAAPVKPEAFSKRIPEKKKVYCPKCGTEMKFVKETYSGVYGGVVEIYECPKCGYRLFIQISPSKYASPR